jgi:hypothetical protein
VAVVSSTELGVDGCGVANALVVHKLYCFVGWFADDCVECGVYKSGADVIEARGSHCHGGYLFLLK